MSMKEHSRLPVPYPHHAIFIFTSMVHNNGIPFPTAPTFMFTSRVQNELGGEFAVNIAVTMARVRFAALRS